MDICKEIKKILVDEELTLTELAKQISQAKNKHYTVQNLSQKLKNGTLNVKEIEIILNTINYKICFLPCDYSR